MVPVLEAVPNFSEGRDLAWIRSLVETVAATGADVLDWSADPDHNRSVVTYLGDQKTVEAASVAAARHALEHLDLRTHEGVHPRVGALDVLPFVPLMGLEPRDAVRSAHRVGEALAGLGLPVYFYGAAHPASRSLAEIRRGGFEAYRDGYPEDRLPDLPPRGRDGPHPTAGVVCVGARGVLLAWNVYVEGVSLRALKEVAAALRERGGGFSSLRVLALELGGGGRRQISMNLEDPVNTSPMAVFCEIERRIEGLGGKVTGTEVVGMIPDALVLSAAEDRLRFASISASRLLSARLAEHVSARASREAYDLLAVLGRESTLSPAAHAAAERLFAALSGTPTPSSGS